MGMEILGIKDIFKLSIESYKKAVSEARLKHFSQAFGLYVETFLPRLNSEFCCEKEFKCFYRLQLATYLCKKNNYYVALPEGDMISDLILSSYIDFVDMISVSKFNITAEGRINLLSELKVDFPLLDPIELAL